MVRTRQEPGSPINCARCERAMNHHAEKFVEWAGENEGLTEGGAIYEIHTCPGCGDAVSRMARDQADQR